MITTSKRLISILICLTLVLAMLPMAVSAASTTTIYYYNVNNWSNVKVHYWSSPTAGSTNWPGNDMTDLGNGYWSIDVPSDVGGLLFTASSSGPQTSDLTLPTDGKNCYAGSSWTVYSGAAVEIEMATVYCDATACGWSNVNAYFWGGTSSAGNWPGTAMTSIGNGVYSIEISADTPNIIFNNGSAQTDDLTFPGDGYIWNGSDFVDYATYTPVGGEVEVDTNYYLRGTMNSWGTTDVMTDNGNGIWTITLTLAAGDYAFKAGLADWSSAIGDPNSGDPDGNALLTLDAETEVTFTLDLNAGTLTNSAQGGNTPDPDPVETIYYIAGSMNGWTASEEGQMTKTGDVYTLVLSLDAGNYTFKTTDSNGAWYPEGMGNDLSVYLVSACDVTFTFDPATGETTATGSGIGEPTPVVYDYYVAGSAGLCGVEWDCAAEANKMDQVGDVYIKTYAGVIAGSYSLKVTNGTWDQSWGGLGENGNYDITVTTLSDVTVTFDGSNVSVDVVPVAYQPTVKYQVTNGATAADATTNVRFLTAVDSLDYSSVVFTLSIAGNEGVPYACETVYEQLVAGDVTYESAAAIFGEGAAYFVAFTLENVPQEYYNETISVSVVLTAKDGSQTTVTRDIVVADALA